MRDTHFDVEAVCIDMCVWNVDREFSQKKKIFFICSVATPPMPLLGKGSASWPSTRLTHLLLFFLLSTIGSVHAWKAPTISAPGGPLIHFRATSFAYHFQAIGSWLEWSITNAPPSFKIDPKSGLLFAPATPSSSLPASPNFQSYTLIISAENTAGRADLAVTIWSVDCSFCHTGSLCWASLMDGVFFRGAWCNGPTAFIEKNPPLALFRSEQVIIMRGKVQLDADVQVSKLHIAEQATLNTSSHALTILDSAEIGGTLFVDHFTRIEEHSRVTITGLLSVQLNGRLHVFDSHLSIAPAASLRIEAGGQVLLSGTLNVEQGGTFACNANGIVGELLHVSERYTLHCNNAPPGGLCGSSCCVEGCFIAANGTPCLAPPSEPAAPSVIFTPATLFISSSYRYFYYLQASAHPPPQWSTDLRADGITLNTTTGQIECASVPPNAYHALVTATNTVGALSRNIRLFVAHCQANDVQAWGGSRGFWHEPRWCNTHWGGVPIAGQVLIERGAVEIGQVMYSTSLEKISVLVKQEASLTIANTHWFANEARTIERVQCEGTVIMHGAGWFGVVLLEIVHHGSVIILDESRLIAPLIYVHKEAHLKIAGGELYFPRAEENASMFHIEGTVEIDRKRGGSLLTLNAPWLVYEIYLFIINLKTSFNREKGGVFNMRPHHVLLGIEKGANLTCRNTHPICADYSCCPAGCADEGGCQAVQNFTKE